MTELPKSVREPFFLECEERRLFAIYHCPANPADVGAGAVYFPPFAEEANRTRRMANLTAECLSGAGTGTLLFDYSSTGDSSGEFAQARWENWVSDGCAAINWLHEIIDKPIALIGLRLGAVLALECAQKVGLDIPRIVLWQPVTDGRTYLTQFLRIRLAASLAGESPRETTKELRERLAAGETLEIAGYEVAPALAEAVGRTELSDIVPPLASKVHWLEVTSGGNDELMPSSQISVDKWRDAGVDVGTSAIKSEQFWATQEISTAPPLIELTRNALTGLAA